MKIQGKRALLTGLMIMWGLGFAVPKLAWATGVEQAEGFYSKGALKNASALPEVGSGFLRLFVPRDRGYGSLNLVELLQAVALEVNQFFPIGERLQLGDLSAENGGKITRHASHQNGLDADLRYFAKDFREQNPQDVGGFDESFVNQGKVTSNFDTDRNWALFSGLVRSGKVQRIFVDQAIKWKFCKQGRQRTPEGKEVLRRLRPYANHADHLHIRLYCPEGSAGCVPQSEVPSESGCGRLVFKTRTYSPLEGMNEHD